MRKEVAQEDLNDTNSRTAALQNKKNCVRRPSSDASCQTMRPSTIRHSRETLNVSGQTSTPLQTLGACDDRTKASETDSIVAGSRSNDTTNCSFTNCPSLEKHERTSKYFRCEPATLLKCQAGCSTRCLQCQIRFGTDAEIHQRQEMEHCSENSLTFSKNSIEEPITCIATKTKQQASLSRKGIECKVCKRELCNKSSMERHFKTFRKFSPRTIGAN